MQRALMLFFKPANYFTVWEALFEAGRGNLIGPRLPDPGPVAEGGHRGSPPAGKWPDHYHVVANPARGEEPGERGAEPRKRKGYRPGRKGPCRQDRTRL